MSFSRVFSAIARQYGEPVSLWRDGRLLGRGQAVLRPLLDRQRQFVPTRLGLRREEGVLCMGEASLPFAPAPGQTVLRQGEEAYDVVNVRAVKAGDRLIYWRAILTRRDEEEP